MLGSSEMFNSFLRKAQQVGEHIRDYPMASHVKLFFMYYYGLSNESKQLGS